MMASSIGTLYITNDSYDNSLTSNHRLVSWMMEHWEPTTIMLEWKSSSLESTSCMPSPSYEVLIWSTRYCFGREPPPSPRKSFKWGGRPAAIYLFPFFPMFVNLWLLFTTDCSWWSESIATRLFVLMPPCVMDVATPTEATVSVTCVPMEVEIKVIHLLESSSEIS